jgi:sulfoxide reductase heme-binding subunit YedZ
MATMRWPWQDRTGRISALKAPIFALTLAPGLWLLGRALAQDLGPRPYNEVIHEIGLWSFRLLLITLAVTPLRRIGGWPKLAQTRRMLGVAAAVYLMIHFVAYVVDLKFDLVKVASEIVKRLYLTIGLVSLLGIMAMAATSTDGMVRRMGARAWQRLHYLAYPMTLLGLIHFFMQAKLEIAEPTLMAGIFGWLMGYRALYAIRQRALPTLWIAGLGLASALLTGIGEAVYFNYLTGAPILRVLEANLSLDLGLRPAAALLLIAVAPTALALAAPLWTAPRANRLSRAS